MKKLITGDEAEEQAAPADDQPAEAAEEQSTSKPPSGKSTKSIKSAGGTAVQE